VIDESYQAEERREGDRPLDAHVVPEAGPEHESSVTCWCLPRLSYWTPDRTGGRVWVHRLMS
jgi:hypothetical protein